MKALCILFSNLKFKIQWKSASNSWLKGDIIRKNTWSHEASGILIFAFALARRENQVPHPAWVFVLCGRGDRMAKRQGPWSPSWNATCLLQAPPRQPTHHRPWGGSSPLHFVSQKLEDGPGNRDLLGGNESTHSEHLKRYHRILLFSASYTVYSFLQLLSEISI